MVFRATLTVLLAAILTAAFPCTQKFATADEAWATVPGWRVLCRARCSAYRGVLILQLDPVSRQPLIEAPSGLSGELFLALPDGREFAFQTHIGQPLDAFWEAHLTSPGAALVLERHAQIAATIPLSGLNQALAALRARQGVSAPTSSGALQAQAIAETRAREGVAKVVPRHKPQVQFAIGPDAIDGPKRDP
ncbi:MAG: hypothetical protein AAF761_06525 [Pseudomonadota bacterium]